MSWRSLLNIFGLGTIPAMAELNLSRSLILGIIIEDAASPAR